MQPQSRPRIVVAQTQKSDLAPIVRKWAGVARRFWYWIALSVIVALAAGYFYLQCQARIYRTSAVVLIDQTDGGSSTMRTKAGNSQINTLMQLNGISASDNLKNEIFILSSLRLMRFVIPVLGLDVDYTTTESLHEVSLYGHQPISVDFEGEAKTPVSMTASVGKDGTVTLTDFKKASKAHPLTEEEERRVVSAPIGKRVATPIGALTVQRGKAFAAFPRGKEITITRYTLEGAAERFHSMVGADELDKESSLIVLTCSDVNTQRSTDVLNTLVDVYKADVINNKNSQAQRTAEFIDGRLEIISRELSDVEGQFAHFKSSNKIADLSATAQAMTQSSLKAAEAATELNTQLSVAKYLADYLRSTTGSNEVIPVVSNFGSSGVAQQIAEYNRQLTERNRIASNTSEDAPHVRELDRVLRPMRSAIYASLESYVRSLELELKAARSTEQSFQAKAGEVPVKEQQVIDIARQQNLKEALYTYLLNKREEVALQLAIEEANVRLVEDPASTRGPVAPRPKVILVIALMVGLVVPFLVFYLIELFDTTVTTRKDVEDALSVPIVGELPHLNHSTDKTLVYAPGADLSAPIAEAFRLLRYGLHYLKPDAKTILVTSSTPSHGKSFVSRNLAAAIAMTKKRVLLIDVDIRVRNVSRNFGLSRASGVTEYLIGDLSSPFEAIVKDCLMEGVDFLPAGTTPPNTTELLMGERLDELIGVLREEYDTIVLDTTPAFAVADASIVSRVCDVTLFVIRVGEQLRAGLPSIEELYKSKKCGNLCAVINDSDRKARSYGYGSDGSYSYSYQYGYGHRKKKRGWKFWK